MGRGKGEPTDKKPDRIIGGFRYGVQKRDILCPDRFDVVQESGDEKSEKREKKWEGKKKICADEAEKAEDDPIEKKKRFFDFTFHKGPVAFRRVVYIERSIRYLVYDVIGGGYAPGEKEGEEGFPDE